MCRSLTDVYPVDIEEIGGGIGKDNAFDPQSRINDNQPFTTAMLDTIAGHIAAMAVQFTRYPLKCLVLDCDNTLWGGILGECGFDGIELSNTGTGRAFKEFQAYIVRLHKQGVLLALCSKNTTCVQADRIRCRRCADPVVRPGNRSHQYSHGRAAQRSLHATHNLPRGNAQHAGADTIAPDVFVTTASVLTPAVGMRAPQKLFFAITNRSITDAIARPHDGRDSPPGRNGPCPCGSGRKYKKCCMRKSA
ncbi:MAG: hypothetical protein GF398_04405 [Chitinivibrionales bacterium]|nr:hypothetical protein [Chitinivibrionales bacterium]